jgi:hypothetical protein
MTKEEVLELNSQASWFDSFNTFGKISKIIEMGFVL